MTRPNPVRRACSAPAPFNYAALEARRVLSTIQVIAAGVTNQEQLQLQLNGTPVQTWNNLGGDAYGGQFVTLSYTTSASVTADQVRLAFLNDLYDPVNNFDRNVRVDAIVIDGQRFETEAPSVFSTGTWKAEDGIQPGYRQSEYLHGNGYVQYASGSGNSGSLLQLRVSGDEGSEQFQLKIAGSVVAGFVATTAWQTFQFRAAATVAPSQVEVVFTNDQYDPANGIDRNLNVDFLSIDGTIFQTEDENVYSTGTWKAEDGIRPGFRQSQTLHANGSFAWDQVVRPGNIQLENSVLTVAESAGSIPVRILRTGGADGVITVDYRTVASSATAGSDYQTAQGTATFLDGETSKVINIPILEDTLVEADEQFGFTIDNVSGGASLLAPRTATITIDDNDSIQATGTGLLGEYFDGANFTSRFLNRIDNTVNFNWAAGAPASGMGADTFSIRWTGKLEPRYSETYTFRTVSDDGVRLWVNNQLIINKWQDQAATAHTGTIALNAGQLYDIRFEYYENLNTASVVLQWSSPSQVLEVIPRSLLYPAEPPPTLPGNQLQNQTLVSGLVQPTSMDFSPDGSKMFIGEQRGIVRLVDNGVLQTSPFLDFRDRVNGTRDRGLLDIAVHPNFPATPYVYLLYTYDPPEVNQQAAGSLAGPDGRGNRAGRMTRVTADAANDFRTVVPNSEVVLIGKNSTWANFNAFVNSTSNFTEPPAGILPNGSNLPDFIATDSESHTVGAIEFGRDGLLYVSIGDGTSYNQVDPRTVRVQDIDNLSGKVLRIDPLTGRGVSNNPFFNGDPDSNRSKVYQLGFRNPFRMAIHPTTGQPFTGDVGWTAWEEINAGIAGNNFGWPYYEGGSGNSLQTNGYKNLAQAQAFYASGQQVTPSFYALNHAASGINAIVLGDFITGTAFPDQYRGDLFFNDLGQGIVRNISFNANGTIAAVETFATGARYVVQMIEGPDGNLYYVDLDDGKIGRWAFPGDGGGNGSGVAAAGSPVRPQPAPEQRADGILIATLDEGLDPAHPQLSGRLWENPAEIPGDGIDNDGNGYVDDVEGFDFVDRDSGITTASDHGTFMAGLLASQAPGAKLLPLRVLDQTAMGTEAAVAEAIQYAVEQGARIICLPARFSGGETVRWALELAASRNVLVIAASGNDGAAAAFGLSALSGRYANLLVAGGLSPEGVLLPESNRVGDGGAVQLDAPGIAFGPLANGSFGTFRGTSVAASALSAAAALALAANPLLTAAQLRQLLVASAGRPVYGSDSAGTLNAAAAVSLAQRAAQITIEVQAGQAVVNGTGGEDRWTCQLGAASINWNGIDFAAPAPAGGLWRFEGNGASDSLRIIGTNGNETGLLEGGHAVVRNVTQQLTATGFGAVLFWGGGGSDTATIRDSAGDDQLQVAPGSAALLGTDGFRSVSGLGIVQIQTSSGNDRAVFTGSTGNDRFVATTTYARLVSAGSTVQANRFDRVTAELGSGFDSAILTGGQFAEELMIGPGSASFRGGWFEVAVTGLERTTANGNGGLDTWTFSDTAGRDVVNSRPGNTLVLGAGYDHRAYGFESTTLVASGGTDRITLIGSVGDDWLQSGIGSFTFATANGFTTTGAGFAETLFQGGGGSDRTEIVGSSGRDEFYCSPELAFLSTLNFSGTWQGFKQHLLDGRGGGDAATLLDSVLDDRLTLRRASTVLGNSAGRSIELSNFGTLRAISTVDSGRDVVTYIERDLDYAFETIGDWIEE
jgi:glucose/arabinose dehydrogenase